MTRETVWVNGDAWRAIAARRTGTIGSLKAMRWVGLLACLALCAAGSSEARQERVASCPPSLANELASTGSARQLVTFVAPSRSSTRGQLRLCRRSGTCWLGAAGAWSAWLGQRGVSDHKREGDRTTPAGAFGFGPVMYGPAEPGRALNRFHHVPCGTRPPFRVTSEDLSRSPTAYRHFTFIRYNVDPVVPGRGSGIFLHASTGRPTLGCISLPLPQLIVVLHWLRPTSDPLIVIGTASEIRRF